MNNLIPFSLHADLAFLNQLPDGRVIKVGTERFQAPEVLFTPVGIWCPFYLCFLLLKICIYLLFGYLDDVFSLCKSYENRYGNCSLRA